jgi:hypothetical protein
MKPALQEGVRPVRWRRLHAVIAHWSARIWRREFMKTLKLFFAAAVALGAVSGAHATTFNLGNVDAETRYFGDTLGKKSGFTDFVKFKLTEQSAVDFTFRSFQDVINSSFAVQLQERASGVWTTIPTASPSFADLSAGKYRWDITGSTGRQSGFWGAKMAVTAVPEADVWMMLLIGLGLVGYQLRRKQQSLKYPPFAA